MRMIPVLLTVTLLPAAATAQSVSRIEGSGGSPDVISSEQIRQTGLEGFSAWEIVERLRPRWFRNRGPTVFDTLQVTVARVVVNGMPVGSSGAPGLRYSSGNQMDDLRSLRGSEIDQMRYLNRSDATTRFGTGYEAGAIVVDLSRGSGGGRGPRTTAERARVGVQPGDRVRFTVDGSWTGVVQSSSSDSISLLVDEVAQQISFSWASVERLEVSAGRKSRRHGAWVGGGALGAVGLVGGFLFGPGGLTHCRLFNKASPWAKAADHGCERISFVEVMGFSAAGMLVGGVVGALVHGGELWRTADVPVQLGFAVTGGGLMAIKLMVPYGL